MSSSSVIAVNNCCFEGTEVDQPLPLEQKFLGFNTGSHNALRTLCLTTHFYCSRPKFQSNIFTILHIINYNPIEPTGLCICIYITSCLGNADFFSNTMKMFILTSVEHPECFEEFYQDPY